MSVKLHLSMRKFPPTFIRVKEFVQLILVKVESLMVTVGLLYMSEEKMADSPEELMFSK